MTQDLLRTPLYEAHKALGARLVPFAGWEMPLQYTGILAEHRAVRTHSGLFDVSHMGRIELRGSGAARLLELVPVSWASDLPAGKGRYSLLCQEDGGIIDDVVFYHLAQSSWLLVCNASNTPIVLPWLTQHGRDIPDLTIEDMTARTVMLAFQGPQAIPTLEPYVKSSLSKLVPFDCLHTTAFGHDCIIARTGYTGEAGVELIAFAGDGLSLWQQLATLGTPCGLGARDTLRLEAALRLYGNDMDTSTNPFEAGLGRLVHLDKPRFVGKAALERIKTQGVSRMLVGFEVKEKTIARHGCPILHSGKGVGKVTSGSYAPTLGKSIGLGFVPSELSAPGTTLDIDIRGRPVPAQVVKLPFYRTPRLASTGALKS